MNPDTVARHAEMLANRVRKNSRRLRKAFERENIGVYRLYDRDIPEVRAVVDRYEDHLVVGEYARTQTADAPEYVEALAAAAGEALGVDPSKLHVKRRRTRPKTGARYHRLAKLDEGLEVRERGLRFWVNLDDYLDTGLFLDHRTTRARVRAEAAGRRVLNLFAYTGAFSVHAAAGGAREVVSVDLSRTYLAWAQDNFELNDLDAKAHRFVHSDVLRWLRQTRDRFDLVILDPPPFSASKRMAASVGLPRERSIRAAREMALTSLGCCRSTASTSRSASLAW